MKILYLTMAPIDETSGVYKKIRAQVDSFIRLGHTCNLLFVRDTGEAFFYSGSDRDTLDLRNANHKKQISTYISKCDFCYTRFELLRHSFYREVLNICNRKKTSIVTEIPTYPPYQESIARVKDCFRAHKYLRGLKTLLGSIFVISDVYRHAQMSKLMVLIADDKKFWFTNTIRIENGIDLAKNPYLAETKEDGKIRIIAVSNFSVWNGYDRALVGMKKYVDSHPNPNIELIMVGGLKEGHSLIRQTKELGLNDYVKFTGSLSGVGLDNAYANADIALAALGNHRRKVFANSSLKVKEYASRGMLMVLSDAEGIENEIRERCLSVTSDESPLDFFSIENWYRSIKDKTAIRKYIHNFAVDNYSWDAQMSIVIEQIKNLL